MIFPVAISVGLAALLVWAIEILWPRQAIAYYSARNRSGMYDHLLDGLRGESKEFNIARGVAALILIAVGLLFAGRKYEGAAIACSVGIGCYAIVVSYLKTFRYVFRTKR